MLLEKLSSRTRYKIISLFDLPRNSIAIRDRAYPADDDDDDDDDQVCRS